MTIIKDTPRKKNYKNDSVKALEKLQKNSSDTQNTNVTMNEDGSADVSLDPEDTNQGLGLGGLDQDAEEHFDNLVDELDSDQVNKLSELVLANVQSDEMSRSDWLKTIEFGLDLLGVKVEEKNIPFEGACSAQHPLLMESAVKFQSKASTELLPPDGPVKTKVLGDCTPEKELQANRVKEHMNYMITEQMTEFYPDSERMLLYVPLVGSGFKKTYYSEHLERPCSEFVPADQFIVPNSAPDLFRADRYTHILYKTEYELEQDFSIGFYTKPMEGMLTPQAPKLTNVQRKTHELIGITVGLGERDRVYTLYEHHINVYIEGLDEETEGEDGRKYKLASPYILTVDAHSRQLIGLKRNWEETDVKRKKIMQFTHYGFVPSFNFYCYGFLHLLGNLQLTLTSSLRSLVDAGQFATLQGGFKLKGVRISDDGTPIHPGQFKDIECAIMDINKAIMPLPFKEPSSVLYQMLEFLDMKGQKFADATEQVIQDSKNYGPVGTTMALLDASTKFFSAIHKRLHKAQREELRIIADINSKTLPDNLDYNIENQTMAISKKDYGPNVSVIPNSDPNISSNAQRMAKAQAMLQIAMQNPQLHDMREVLRHVYINMDYPNVDKILPMPQQAQPQDPLTDLQSVQGGMPIKAFPGQDHKAHIAIKQAFLQDPNIGQNPIMQKASITVQANIQEHIMMNFIEQTQAMTQQIQQQGGQGQQQQQDPTVQAAQKVAQLNLQNLQQQVAQGQANDPKSQAAMILAHSTMQDSQTKQRKQHFDEIKGAADIHLKSQQLDLEKTALLHKAVMEEKKPRDEINKIVATKGIDALINHQSAQNQMVHNQQQHQNTQHQNLQGHLQDKDLADQQHQQDMQQQRLDAQLNPTPSPAPKGQ